MRLGSVEGQGPAGPRAVRIDTPLQFDASMGRIRRRKVEVSPRKGSNRVKSDARRVQARTGDNYARSLRSLGDITLDEIRRAAQGASASNVKSIAPSVALLSGGNLAVSATTVSASSGALGARHSCTIIRIKRCLDARRRPVFHPIRRVGGMMSQRDVLEMSLSPQGSGDSGNGTRVGPQAWITCHSTGAGQRVVRFGADASRLSEVDPGEAALVDSIVNALGWLRDGCPSIEDVILPGKQYAGLPMVEDHLSHDPGSILLSLGRHAPVDAVLTSAREFLSRRGDGREPQSGDVVHSMVAPNDGDLKWLADGETHPAQTPATYVHMR